MQKDITFTVDSDLYEKFNVALRLSEESFAEAVNTSFRWYIAQVFEKVSKEYYPKVTKQVDENRSFYGKALQRIPMWALKPNQYNHKIIKAYFMSIDITGEATLIMMERLCSDKNCPDLYVPTFRNNYSQMKLDSPKSHGKVFEDDGEHVWIWDGVIETLMQYKDSFMPERSKQ